MHGPRSDFPCGTVHHDAQKSTKTTLPQIAEPADVAVWIAHGDVGCFVSDAVTEFLAGRGGLAPLPFLTTRSRALLRVTCASGGRGNCLVECSISQLLFSRFQDLVEQRSVGTGFEVFQRAQESG